METTIDIIGNAVITDMDIFNYKNHYDTNSKDNKIFFTKYQLLLLKQDTEVPIIKTFHYKCNIKDNCIKLIPKGHYNIYIHCFKHNFEVRAECNRDCLEKTIENIVEMVPV
jgi:hypothetical protein